MKTTVERIDVSRRGFLGTVFSAGALVLGAPLVNAGEAFGAEVVPSKDTWWPSVYLGVQPDSTVIIVAHRSEMGTGIRTALPMVAADELDVEWSKVRIEQALGDKKYGDQNTDGSNSIRSFYEPLRAAGATAKAMLIAAAAAKWKVPAGDIKAANGYVTHGTSKASYGELVSLAAMQPVPKPETLQFKSPAGFGARNFRHGCEAAGDGLCVNRTSAGGGRRRKVCRRCGGAEGARRETDRPDRQIQRSVSVSAAGRRGGNCRQHLGGDAGPEEAEDRMGPWPERDLRFRFFPQAARGNGQQAV
jgi:hypothetical protein